MKIKPVVPNPVRQVVTFSLDTEVVRRLAVLATRWGCKKSEAVRRLVRNEQK